MSSISNYFECGLMEMNICNFDDWDKTYVLELG